MTCDLRVNYGSYYDGVFVMDTEYTLNPSESEYSYINNVMLVLYTTEKYKHLPPVVGGGRKEINGKIS